ncbi:delta(14)-sterol reductase TM7SF2 [Solenopsis invicta]|uniref:delta(14)-sterol reductase TM7SF2 n=1 Tax=Solenopsis invicta TaxID=13686 RepID=UPI0005963401|nr:delta(14)-sterol reductase TM7SF2 [Solenopsis invicta]XP_039303076.1 delta(14)-sterol reductase TM7SF2 [Solenopsis invicta]
MKFTEGEEVLAKHPNTSEYYKGKILNVRGDRYKIHFETGVEHTVRENDIKADRTGRTTVRASRRKSPSRQSPSRRSPSRRSPARQVTKSPGRSPTSTSRKLPIRSTRLAKISLSRIDVEGDKMSNHKGSDAKALEESPTESLPLHMRMKREIMSVTRRPTLLKADQEYKSTILTRSIDRASSLPVERKNYVQDYPPGEKERGYSMQRDQDVTKEESEQWETVMNREKEIHRVDKPQEWGGWIGTSFLVFILPLSIILPQLLCSKGQCKTALVKLSVDWKSYINLHALSYVAFLTSLACISIIPIGKIINGQQSKIGRLQYRVNGFLSAIVAIIGLALCVYLNIPISDYILNNIVQLSISGWIVGTILAMGLYIKAGKISVINLNIYASTNSKIYNFWQGREINPRIGALDIKLLLIRASLIGTLIINIAIAIKAVGDIKTLNIQKLDVATLLAVLLQLFYVIHGLIYETTIFTSFTIMYEGTGYMTCVSHLLYPFLTTLTTRFLLYQKMKLNYYFAGISVLSFVVGYALYRTSNLRKDEFRKNPVSPTVPYSETIPTSRGKKLMLSGLWGYVRHPNYLGDIIMQWSVASIGLAKDILPYYTAICCTLVLAYRAIRDNRRCQMRYGYAWEQYCSRVKYMILKRIF